MRAILIAAILACGCTAPRQQAGPAPLAPAVPHAAGRVLSEEVVLASNYDDPNVGNQNFACSGTSWHAAVFKPVVPPDATSCSITSVTVYVGKSSAQNTLTKPWDIIIRPLDANGKPRTDSYQDIDKYSIPAANVPLIASGQAPPPATTATFTHAVFDPAKGIAVVIGPESSSPTGYIAVQRGGGTQSPPDLDYYTGASGATWQLATPTIDPTARDLLIEVRGTYTTP